jgi:hypothetical protein
MASTPKGFDVVGVDSGSHGRSCTQHSVCGHFVVVNDKLYCKWAVQSFDDTPESCVQVYKLAADGHVGCHVGYLPRRLVKSSTDKNGEKDGGKSYEGMWLKVIKDLRTSDNSSERSRSYRNCGIIHCYVANDPFLVGKDPFQTSIVIPESEVRDPKKFKQSHMPADPNPNEEDDTSSDNDDNEYDGTTCTPRIDPNETLSDKEE